MLDTINVYLGYKYANNYDEFYEKQKKLFGKSLKIVSIVKNGEKLVNTSKINYK